MRILVYGAGNIGSLYAALLKESGEDVSILARGKRLSEIRDHGVQLEDFATGRQTTVRVKTVERLDVDDRYDVVLVILPKHRIPDVLPILAANRHTPSVMFFSNNAAGPGEMIKAVGRDRVLLGFPGAGAVSHNHRIRYLILSAREQPTTIGEPDGRSSERVSAIGDAFRAAGFPVDICPNMDAWLKTHAMKIAPTAGALYMEGDAISLARSQDALLLMIRAIREGFRVLHQHGVPITPAINRIFEWIPERVLLALAKRMLQSDAAAIKIGHAQGARDEMKLIAEEVQSLAERTSVPTPAMDRLCQYIAPAVESVDADGWTHRAGGTTPTAPGGVADLTEVN